MESGGPDRRKRSYLRTKSTAMRTRGRQSQRASMDGGPTGVEDCARAGPVWVGGEDWGAGGNNESGDD